MNIFVCLLIKSTYFICICIITHLKVRYTALFAAHSVLSHVELLSLAELGARVEETTLRYQVGISSCSCSSWKVEDL